MRALAYSWTSWHMLAANKIFQERRSSCFQRSQWECCHCLWGKCGSALFSILFKGLSFFLLPLYFSLLLEKVFHNAVCVYSFVSSCTKLGLFRCWETREINFASDLVLCDCISSTCWSAGDSKYWVLKERAEVPEESEQWSGHSLSRHWLQDSSFWRRRAVARCGIACPLRI